MEKPKKKPSILDRFRKPTIEQLKAKGQYKEVDEKHTKEREVKAPLEAPEALPQFQQQAEIPPPQQEPPKEPEPLPKVYTAEELVKDMVELHNIAASDLTNVHTSLKREINDVKRSQIELHNEVLKLKQELQSKEKEKKKK